MAAKYYHKRSRRAFFLLAAKLAALGSVVGGLGLLIAVIYGEQLIAWLFGSEFVRNDVFIVICAAGWIQFTSSPLGHAITAARYIRVQVPLQLSALVTIMLVCRFLVPTYGILGAAYGLLACNCVQAFFLTAVLSHLFTRKIWLKQN